MCVAVGIGPAEALDLDASWFDALERQADERWPIEVELAAMQAELLSALFTAYSKVHGKKGAAPPPVLNVPRPGSPRDSHGIAGPSSGKRAAAVSPAAFARMVADRVEPAGTG